MTHHQRSLIAAASAAVVLVATAANASVYLPTGVQTNVLSSTVTGGGWTECSSTPYGAFSSLANVFAACSAGTKLMMAARAYRSDTLLALAEADRTDVLFETGVNYTVTHNANGVEWYFDPSWSWGFANGGQAVNKNSCDTLTGADRVCWHTADGNMSLGYRIGNVTTFDFSYERVLFTFTGDANGGGAVPEPASWALMIGGFGMAGAALRRRRAVAA